MRFVYTSGEGQTAKIANTLATQLQTAGHIVQVVDLGRPGNGCDPVDYEAVIIAASVHAGKHQTEAIRFVKKHRNALGDRVTAFVSVSLAAAATKAVGLRQASDQAQAFFAETDWKPELVEHVAGAFRLSRFSPWWRWMIKAVNTMARKKLIQQGWPDLSRDQEFTDWNALRRFGERFAALL